MFYLILTFLFLSQDSFALNPLEESSNSIKKMQGCYEVQFQFAETFPRKAGYETQDPYFAGALEWVELDVDTTDKIELQHLLIVGQNTIIKHWRQEWTYEPTQRFAFKGDRVWIKEDYPSQRIAGHWEQNVSQVDDSPRYECSAPWIHQNNKNYWECSSWNPLPRREFSKRNDYNVLKRRNRHSVFDNKWVHEQDNEKIVAKEGVLTEVLTEEKGKNLYTKVDDSRCQPARDWWAERKGVWTAIRLAWDDIHYEYERLEFKKLSRPLWRDLFAMAETAYSLKWNSKQIKNKALETIKKHLN